MLPTQCIEAAGPPSMVHGPQGESQAATAGVGNSSVAAQGEGVAALPVGTGGGANELVGAVALLAQAAAGLAGGSQAAQLTVLLDGVADPVDAGVVLDGSVLGVHQDDLEVLVGGVLVDPVRAQHTQVAAAAAHTLLSDGSQVALELQLVDTVVLGLTVHNALGVGALASTTAHGHAVHGVALLGLVAEAACLLGAGGVVHSHHVGELAVLPCAHAQQKAEHIALLLAPDLLHVRVGTHV